MSSTRHAARSVVEDRIEVVARPLLGGGRLVRDYMAGVDLSAFFTGHYTDPSAYERKAAEVEARLDATARALLAPAIEPLGDSAARLSRILAGDGFFVTTGQQPALFGGPLYTVYKVLGAIRLAAILERQFDKPVLALFWVGSDDHDWDEANHSTVPDAQDYARTITVHAPRDADTLPMGQRQWGAGVQRAVDEFAAALPDTAHRAEVIEHVRATYSSHATVSASFTDTMRYLLHDRRVAIIDSAHPALRRAAAPILRTEVERSREHAALLTEQTDRLERAGYSAQVAIAEDAANLMFISDRSRDRLVRTGRGWRTRRERGSIADGELLAMMDAQPDAFSPNVLLRPVVESAVLPTLAYVAGPGEVSYFAQIGCLFTAHGILPPIVVPRPSVLLLTPKVRTLLERLGVAPDALMRPFRDVVTDAISAEVPARVEHALRALRSALAAGYEELADEAGLIDATLRRALNGPRNASLHEVNAAERKIRAQVRRSNVVRIEQLRRAAAHVHPIDSPQERVFGPLPYVAMYGRQIIADVEAALDVLPARIAEWQGPRCP